MSLKTFNLREAGYSESLSRSIVSWLDDRFFEYGNYFTTSGELQQVSHPNYEDGMVWGSNKKNWIWQSGMVDVGINGSPTIGYSINYRDGLVIFDSVQTGTVQATYSHKVLDIFDVNSNKFFRSSYGTLNVYNGVYREDSVQLPAICLEMGSLNSEPYQLGSYSRDMNQGIVLNIYHRNSTLVDRISETLFQQLDSHIPIFDFDRAYASGDYPLEYDGTIINPDGNHDYLVENHPFTKISNNTVYIEDSEIEKSMKIDNNLYHGTVRYNLNFVYSMGL